MSMAIQARSAQAMWKRSHRSATAANWAWMNTQCVELGLGSRQFKLILSAHLCLRDLNGLENEQEQG